MDKKKLWGEQKTSILQFIRSIAYHRNVVKVKNDVKIDSCFWNATSTAHLLVATLEWSKVFGSDQSEKTHWKNTVNKEQEAAFNEVAIAAAGSKEEWTKSWKKMNSFRCQFVAHTDIASDLKSVPSFDIPLKIAVSYLKWMHDLAKDQNVRFSRNHDPELFYDNVTSESMPVITDGLLATDQYSEHS